LYGRVTHPAPAQHTHTHTHTHTDAQTHAYTHTRTQTHKHTAAPHIYKNISRHIQVKTHTHTHTHAHIHTHTHTHTDRHTHTHTHTPKKSFSWWSALGTCCWGLRRGGNGGGRNRATHDCAAVGAFESSSWTSQGVCVCVVGGGVNS